MAIPPFVQAIAGYRQWVGVGVTADESERVLLSVSEQALRQGARAGLEALVEAAMRLSRTGGAALHEGGRCVVRRGQTPSAPAQAHPSQRLQAGRVELVLGEPRGESVERERLQRLVELGAALLAARDREETARTELTRQRQGRLRLLRLLSHRERTWSRTSHDLRTPLLVLQGYLEMMGKGIAGALTPPVQRYLERMMKSAADLNGRLQRSRWDHAPPENLGAALSAAFGPGRSARARLELPEEPVTLRSTPAEVALWVRSLERLLAGTGATQGVLRVEAAETPRAWRLHLRTEAKQPVPTRVQESLERLARRGEASLSWGSGPGLELTVLLNRPL